jgi:hypothetical protein
VVLTDEVALQIYGIGKHAMIEVLTGPGTASEMARKYERLRLAQAERADIGSTQERLDEALRALALADIMCKLVTEEALGL